MTHYQIRKKSKMKIADIDYYSIYGKSWLNKIPAKYKLLAAVLIFCSVVFIKSYIFFGILYAFLLFIILFSKLPKLIVLSLSFYPLIFTIFILLSIKNADLGLVLMLIFKILTASTTFSILILTTSYVENIKHTKISAVNSCQYIVFNIQINFYPVENTPKIFNLPCIAEENSVY